MKITVPIVKDTLRIGRFLIPYRIYENKGPQIIFVNGVQQSMAMWHSFISRFSRDHRIILFDFPNQGKAKIISGPPRQTLDEQVEILSAVVEKVRLSVNATLCAASWGGVVAAGFASKYPDRIKRLVLASLGTKPNKKMVETIKKGSVLDIKDRGQMAKTLIKSFGEALPTRIKQGIMRQFQTMKEESMRAFLEHGLFVISSKSLSEIVDLRKIKAQTILLNGEKDTIIDLEDVKLLSSLIPNCEMRIIKDVGHFLHMEREEVLDVYEDILRAHR